MASPQPPPPPGPHNGNEFGPAGKSSATTAAANGAQQEVQEVFDFGMNSSIAVLVLVLLGLMQGECLKPALSYILATELCHLFLEAQQWLNVCACCACSCNYKVHLLVGRALAFLWESRTLRLFIGDRRDSCIKGYSNSAGDGFVQKWLYCGRLWPSTRFTLNDDVLCLENSILKEWQCKTVCKLAFARNSVF